MLALGLRVESVGRGAVAELGQNGRVDGDLEVLPAGGFPEKGVGLVEETAEKDARLHAPASSGRGLPRGSMAAERDRGPLEGLIDVAALVREADRPEPPLDRPHAFLEEAAP